MTCANCEKATLYHQWGGFTAQCMDCQIREIVASPQFYDSRKSKTITPDYRQMLTRLWGDQWRSGHAKCRAVYEAQQKSRQETHS